MKHLRNFIFTLVMLALVALMTCGPVSAEEPDTGEVMFDSTYLAENPELMVALRYMDSVNLEPMHTEGYENIRGNERITNSAFYAANPELIFAHHYIAALEGNSLLFASR